jgi:sugar/nucleoside kinase (ribokinase family)
MLRTARERGLTTSLDTCWDPHNEWTQVLEPCLPNLDILFMNEDEATQIASGRTMEVLARAVMEQGPAMVVIKLGREGCRIYTATQNVICPAYDVEARDTTGAGDCFVAGFLAAYLDGASAERAGSMGNGTGALSVQQIGAVDGLLPRPEQEAWMARTALRRGERGPAGA